MERSLLLSLGENLVIEQISQEERHFIVSVRSTASLARCPLCATPSESIHSHYQRTVADLPCAGQLVILKLTVRRFFCRNSTCPRAIFTERLPDLVQPRARMTKRLQEALGALSFATCAGVGSSLAPRLGMESSPSTLLRCQKAAPLVSPEPFTKIGLDDFAFRRGRTYGTLIVNLETHRLIDILPDRTAATVTSWPAAHPDIDVISRDRASDYATAATAGAPQAIQVCDRWHLLRNLSEYVTTFLARMRAQIRKASQALAPPGEEDPLEDQLQQEREVTACARETRRAVRQARKSALEQAKEARAAQRWDQYQQVLALRDQGLSSYEIAPRVGISARTIRQWLADGIEARSRRRRPSPLDAYVSYLRQRWKEGEQNGERLYAELQTRGYAGSILALYRYLNRWRPPRMLQEKPEPSKRRPRRSKKTVPSPGPFDECNAKQAVWLYLRSPDELSETEQEQLTFFRQVHPSLELVYQLVQEFTTMVRALQGERLETWLADVRASHIPELLRFVKALNETKPLSRRLFSFPTAMASSRGMSIGSSSSSGKATVGPPFLCFVNGCSTKLNKRAKHLREIITI